MKTNFRDYLKDEFNLRKTRNPKYSMRAFARDLELRPSRLSEIMSSKYGISESEAIRIGEHLEFTEWQFAHFCALVASEHGRSQVDRKIGKEKIQELMRQLEAGENEGNDFAAIKKMILDRASAAPVSESDFRLETAKIHVKSDRVQALETKLHEFTQSITREFDEKDAGGQDICVYVGSISNY